MDPMRFNLDDLKRGNVGKARIDEVVLKTILKVDEKYAKREDIMRTSSSLINTLQKQFIFKKAEGDDKETISEKMTFKKNMDTLKFFNKIALANMELLRYEAMIAEIKKQELQKAYMQHLAHLSKKLAAKLISELDYQRQFSELQAAQYQALLSQRDQTLGRIGELLNHRDNLLDSIRLHEDNMVAIRDHYCDEATQYMGNVMFNGRYVFADNTQEEIEQFKQDAFNIEAISAKSEAEQFYEIDDYIDGLIEIERSKKREPGSKKSSQPAGVMFNYADSQANSNIRISQLEQERERRKAEVRSSIKEARIDAYIRVAENSNIKFINKDDRATAEAAVSAFSQTKGISNCIQELRKETREQVGIAQDLKSRVNGLNAAVAAEVSNFNQLLSANQNIPQSESLHINFDIEKLRSLKGKKDLASQLRINSDESGGLDVSECNIIPLNSDQRIITHMKLEDVGSPNSGKDSIRAIDSNRPNEELGQRSKFSK